MYIVDHTYWVDRNINEIMRILTVRVALPHEPKPVIEGLNCEFAPQSELNGIVMLSHQNQNLHLLLLQIIPVEPVCVCMICRLIMLVHMMYNIIARPRMPRRRSVHACARTMHQVKYVQRASAAGRTARVPLTLKLVRAHACAYVEHATRNKVILSDIIAKLRCGLIHTL